MQFAFQYPNALEQRAQNCHAGRLSYNILEPDVAAMTLYVLGTGYHLPGRKGHWTILESSPLLLRDSRRGSLQSGLGSGVFCLAARLLATILEGEVRRQLTALHRS